MPVLKESPPPTEVNDFPRNQPKLEYHAAPRQERAECSSNLTGSDGERRGATGTGAVRRWGRGRNGAVRQLVGDIWVAVEGDWSLVRTSRALGGGVSIDLRLHRKKTSY